MSRDGIRLALRAATAETAAMGPCEHAPSGGHVDENTRATEATNERSLDAGESWGQGADASHRETALEEALPNDVGTDPSLAGDPGEDDAHEADAAPLT